MEKNFSCPLSLTSAIDGGGWVVSATPRPLYPREKEPVHIVYEEAGWVPGPVWTDAENLAPPGFDPQTIQPVASRCTDCLESYTVVMQ